MSRTELWAQAAVYHGESGHEGRTAPRTLLSVMDRPATNLTVANLPGGVPLFADEGVVDEGEEKCPVHSWGWSVGDLFVQREGARWDHEIARPVGLDAVVLRVRAVVAREVALQGENRSGRCRVGPLGRVARVVVLRWKQRPPLGLVHESGQGEGVLVCGY
eukprot:scaffold18007_cov65-Phaeocystis_antarctica.AAC.4